MPKLYEPHTMLLSPRVAKLLDDETARMMAGQLEAMQSQEGHPLDLPHGPAHLWGVEIEDAEDANRTYRVAFVVEEEWIPPRRTFLSVIAVEEQSELNNAPASRGELPGWRTIELKELKHGGD